MRTFSRWIFITRVSLEVPADLIFCTVAKKSGDLLYLGWKVARELSRAWRTAPEIQDKNDREDDMVQQRNLVPPGGRQIAALKTLGVVPANLRKAV